MEIKELLERNQRASTDDEWLQLRDDMIQFLKEDHPIEEKRKLAPFGCLESVLMICSDIEAEREEEK